MRENPSGNYQDKYHSRNPIARWLVNGFMNSFTELALAAPPREAVEIGCGEGVLTRLLAHNGFKVRGYDISARAISEARRMTAEAGMSLQFEQAPLVQVAQHVRAPLIVCCEVLEHLPDPHAGLAELAAMAEPWLLVSVPREPLWRALNLCRGHYIGDLGNTPGHLNHWSSAAFQRFLRPHFEIVALRQPLPWTMALCRKI